MRTLPPLMAGGLAAVVLAAVALPARALSIALNPLPQRVAQAEQIVVGKVISIEPKPIKSARFPGDKLKGEYLIAVVKVEEGWLGAKGLTHVRVGFLPPPPDQPARLVNPNGGRAIVQIRPAIARIDITLAKDQEVCLLLRAHHDAAFQIIPGIGNVFYKTNPNFAKEVEEVRRYVKLLDDPLASLRAKSAEDRFATAAMQLTRYRWPRQFMANKKTEPIDAEESKLILHAIAGANWEANQGRFDQLAPAQVVTWVGATAADGWVYPKNPKDLPAVAKKWLEEHKDTFRIHKYVFEPMAVR